VHIIARKKIRDFIAERPDSEGWLTGWWHYVSRARWELPSDVKRDYPAVDRVCECFVFDVCRNKYRLIVRVTFAREATNGTVYVKHVLTHKDYDKNQWMKDCRK
jgi:mRNA interferase HigB